MLHKHFTSHSIQEDEDEQARRGKNSVVIHLQICEQHRHKQNTFEIMSNIQNLGNPLS